ncbi:hypothetical protein B0A69_00765 [Chryseobacterium shigense]|uniref:Uncharacterized protein n=1 Tax=Chryseobacterium shigense TaxID=297244 RepID=A0A1N7HZV5_9FLAO|nr:hypothetical protein [Chryseobacterium shigense]PQA97898.1 hypothetical protein B0A69_00765 [Chryseobacterium shigense]SIS30291.1 hypothetical protein SAMN05421639_101820 [Chryseobacterium shigense]
MNITIIANYELVRDLINPNKSIAYQPNRLIIDIKNGLNIDFYVETLEVKVCNKFLPFIFSKTELQQTENVIIKPNHETNFLINFSNKKNKKYKILVNGKYSSKETINYFGLKEYEKIKSSFH